MVCYHGRPWEMGPDDRLGNTTRRIRGARAQELLSDILQPGTLVGDYKVVDVIAVGGFGAVYQVEHAILGRAAALKILHRELGSTGDAARRFEREAKAVNIIQHPNVVDIFDFGRLPDGQPYFVMELLSGQDLQTHIEERGRLTLDEAMSILEPLCSALEAAHARGIVHRDIKASNVFRHDRPEGLRVVLLDFGVAKLLHHTGSELTTASHCALGTPACMAPEQIVGGTVSARTDVYALGALTYHMLTGELPFADSSITMMQQMHVHAQRPSPSTVVPAVRALDDVVVKAMSRNPDGRYPSVSDFLDAVRARAGAGQRGTVPPRLTRGIGVHLEILVDARDLEEPDARLLDDIDAIGAACGSALQPRGFERILDASTTALFVRVIDAGDEAQQVRDTVVALQEVVRSLESRRRPEARIEVSLVVHVDAVLASQGAVKGGELLQLASWVPVGRTPGIVTRRTVVDGADLQLEPLDDELVRIVS